ncbi:MAG: acyl-CoA thioesterase [Chloroflexi bacterium]|nr:acyl-CoA thioesterase [Chloroflexota bacterium]
MSTSSLFHERTFRIRHYECDAYGHVNNANYVRYMQEAAFDASAAIGYDFNRYIEMNCLWLIRETDIEYLRPLKYGDSVRVKTWVDDFRRVRSRRMYELYSLNDGELAARANTDWVFIDTKTNRPATIPDEMIRAFLPAHDSKDAPPRQKFPVAPPPPPGVFKMYMKVPWRDVDTAGHVNNAMYLSYISDCGMAVAAHFGWTIQKMWGAGFGIIVRRHQIEYLREAFMDDDLEIATYLSDLKRATAIRHYTITRVKDNELLTRVRTLYVWIDPKTGSVKRMPEEFLRDFEGNVAK